MRIPIAKEIQEKVNNGDVLVAIEWFKWTLFGLRFTYHTAAKTEWSCSNLYAIERSDFSEEEYLAGYEIDDKFLRITPFKTFGIPLKGQGYVFGLDFRSDGIYYDFIYETEYLAHIYVKMTSKGEFDNKIIVPPTWDLVKREKILLSKAEGVKVQCANILEIPTS
ncbi:hypothetical protein [Lachnospira multipara]|uniref:Uncharacterized protein n=1 Tax=Lachnospira multipara TaxID=28051 RepID=A0A1H5VVE3_9FIRM|nr:hypothetical protein [Lachnospira multipara]SEF91265.1 hypothetical protein SAMN05216537_112125 [Lachnospira multipara]